MFGASERKLAALVVRPLASKLSSSVAAWLDHWDAREQNSMDIWMASDAEHKRSSPGHVVHYLLDTSDTLGGEVSPVEMSRRLGHSYTIDFVDFLRSLLTVGIEERPWDRARPVPHRELLEHVWGYSPKTRTRTLYSTLHRLRQTIERDASGGPSDSSLQVRPHPRPRRRAAVTENENTRLRRNPDPAQRIENAIPRRSHIVKRRRSTA